MKNRLKWIFVLSSIMFAVLPIRAQQTPEQSSDTKTAAADATPGNTSGAMVPDRSPEPSPNGDVHQVGGSVRPPVAIYTPDPKYSNQARKAQFSGTVVVAMIVDTEGKPQDVHVLRGVGMGLDEEAVKAVQQYKFKPATRDGKPVAVHVNVQVNFQILHRQ